MNSEERKILSGFKAHRQTYVELENLLFQKISKIIKDNHLFVMSISHRTKEADSLEGKLKRKPDKYKSIYDITDLVGFRIICYFSDAIDTISGEIEKNFIVDEENSIDKREMLNVNEFGYLSVHYICSLKDEDCENEEFKNIRFEFQIRSVLQHAWAEIEHDLGYKSSYGIPKPIRRDFSRMAGLLELADKQFLELRNRVHEYEGMVNEKIINNNASDVLLDRVSLAAFTRLNTDFKNFVNKIDVNLGVSTELINPENYVDQIQFFNVTNISELSNMFNENKLMIYQMIQSKVEAFELDIITSNMIFRYLCRAELVRRNYSLEEIEKFIRITTDNPTKIKVQVNKVLEFMDLYKKHN